MSKFTISKVVAREIIDCRGWPTVQADVWVEGALKGRADVPAGRSTGSHEAHELRDGDQGRYNGLGVLKAVKNANAVYAMDLAANSWYNKEKNVYELDGQTYDRDALIDLYKQVAAKYPIASMEDPLQEDDFEGFAMLTEALDIQIVGDDLFVTNSDRLKKGIQKGAANAMLFKVNQIGMLSEALDAADFAYRNNYGVQVSERSGETEDPIISDLAVALNSGLIKTGMPVRGERTSKHNRLIQIEEELGDTAVYAGKNFAKPS